MPIKSSLPNGADELESATSHHIFGRHRRLMRYARCQLVELRRHSRRATIPHGPGRGPIGGFDQDRGSAQLGGTVEGHRTSTGPSSIDAPALTAAEEHRKRQNLLSPLVDRLALSQALAILHSRATVASDTPTTSAVSSIVRPPKYRSSTIRSCRGSNAARRSSDSCSARTSIWLGSFAARSTPVRVTRSQSPPRRSARRRLAYQPGFFASFLPRRQRNGRGCAT
jgi:hypothetical protein